MHRLIDDPPPIDDEAEAILHMHGIKFVWSSQSMEWHLRAEWQDIQINQIVAITTLMHADATLAVVKLILDRMYNTIGKRIYHGN